jgi:hypothetical protein
MDIVLQYDTTTSDAPSGFTSALTYAADQLDALITNDITVTIAVSWDNTGSILGEGGSENMPGYSYAQVVAALEAHATSPTALEAVSSLPAADPTDGAGIYLSGAQAAALGLPDPYAAASYGPEGAVTFGTGGTVLNFSTTDFAVPNEEDFVGVAEHELTHAIGRDGWGNGSYFSLMDLFRYTSPGTIVTSADPNTATSPAAYFSINGGETDLATFSTYSDYYDWASTNGPDSFDAFSTAGLANTISSVDQTLLSALGFDVACFCPGTRIGTPGGERAVEALRIGDEVLTRFGGVQRIKWIGRSTHQGRTLGTDPLLLPVSIAAGALGENEPACALTVSPGHALFVAGVLVPAWRLVNGVSITQTPCVDEVRYLHIELDRHDLILSNGSWSESYLNETPRVWFDNADEYAALYPGVDMPGPACLPRVEGGLALLAVQHLVNRRAGLATPAESGGDLAGEVDVLRPDLVAGWAMSGEAPVMLLVMAGGEIVARVPANRYRPDLRARGEPCRRGFAVSLPPGARGPISVRRALDGVALRRSNRFDSDQRGQTPAGP